MHDLIVIGCGPGGYAASIRASQLGGKVAVIEAADIGGTCVNRGCIPAKVWHKAASTLQSIRKGADFGIEAAEPKLNLKTVVERKNGVSGEIRMGMEGLLANNGVELIRGRAVFKGPQAVEVGGNTLEAKKFIIASGSSLAFPEVPGLKDAAMTTDDLLEMTQAPASILICRADFIEVEMANILNTFGCKVVLVTDASRILAREDHDTSQRVAQALREQGVEIVTRATLESVKKKKGGFACQLAGPKERTVEVAKVLVSSRAPNTAEIGLDKLGMKLNEDGSIQINDSLETSVGGIYAIGDCTGGWMLSHSSSSMAVTAAENAMGQKGKYPFHLIPRGSWTSPEVGSVGLSEEEAEKRGLEIEIGIFPFSINGLAACRNEVDGAVKIVSEAKYGEILGVHIVGGGATELVGEAVLAMQLECTAREFARSIRIHPTFSEAVVDAARDAEKWALYLPRR
ncbi:MAG: dihydrolipoyl dehydrogenase [Thermodesulfobacteriota bacterium]